MSVTEQQLNYEFRVEHLVDRLKATGRYKHVSIRGTSKCYQVWCWYTDKFHADGSLRVPDYIEVVN